MTIVSAYSSSPSCSLCGGWECSHSNPPKITVPARYIPSVEQAQRELFAHPDNHYLAILALGTEEELRG
jgi:hypothetical protein